MEKNSSFVFNLMVNSTNSTVYYDGPVLLDEGGEIIRAITIDFPLLLLKILLCSVGVPLNTAAIILTLCRQCVNKIRPRNVFLLASFFSNLTIFIPSLLEIAYYFFPSVDLICTAFVATAGLSELCILQSTLLSLIDRYLTIQCPLWHWNKFTAPWATFWIILSFILGVLVIKFVYIFGIYQLGCHIHFVSNRILGISIGILFVLCLIGRVIVFIQTRTLLRNATAHHQADGEMVELHDLNGADGQQRFGDNTNDKNIDLPLVGVVRHQTARMDAESLRRLEGGATKTMVAGVTSLFLFTFPRLAFYLIINICKANSLDRCSRNLVPTIPYFKQLGLLYAIYHPIIHMYWNKELIAGGRQQQHLGETRRRNSIYD